MEVELVEEMYNSGRTLNTLTLVQYQHCFTSVVMVNLDWKENNLIFKSKQLLRHRILKTKKIYRLNLSP